MSKMAKPLIVIVIAIALAAGAAIYLSREDVEVAGTSEAAPISAAAISGGGTIKGPQDAPVTLIEFGDYQCPSCKAYYPIVNEVLSRFPNQVKLEFHHFPLVQIHANSMAAAMAVEAAGQQGRYWDMHDLIFDTQNQWSAVINPETDFLALANRLGLNSNQFMQSVRSPELQQKILQDVVRARDLRIEAVPTFFINGEYIDLPPSVPDFVAAIESKLAALPK